MPSITHGATTVVEFVTLNGTAVRVSSFAQRTIAQEGRSPLREVALVVVLRGATAHHAFLGLLASTPIRVDIPDGPSFAAAVERTTHTVTGAGQRAAHRHELVLQEIAPSAAPANDGSVPRPRRQVNGTRA